MASVASKTLVLVELLPCGKPMTGQILTVVFSRAFRACGIEYGLMHAVATLYFADIASPSEMPASVIVGWRREWSIIFARRGRDTLVVNIAEDELMMAI